jgi:hypothetical protein
MNTAKLSGGERITRAKERADKLIDHIATLFLMHEANALVVYSPTLAGQIPRSYAAHAFNQFQRSMHLFEIVRLCALWDPPELDRESIPTIIELFNEPALVDQIAREQRDRYANEAEPADLDETNDPQLAAALKASWKKDRSAFAQKTERQVRQQLTFAAKKAAKVRSSLRLRAMRKFRNAYIAHNLTLPEPNMKTEEKVSSVRYGDETALLADTVAVADALHCGLNGTSFDWEESKAIARKNASALWGNCSFNIPSRPIQK